LAFDAFLKAFTMNKLKENANKLFSAGLGKVLLVNMFLLSAKEAS
jgi:hypothetical protein